MGTRIKEGERGSGREGKVDEGMGKMGETARPGGKGNTWIYQGEEGNQRSMNDNEEEGYEGEGV